MNPNAGWIVAADIYDCRLIMGESGRDDLARLQVARMWASEGGDFPVWLRDKLAGLSITAAETQKLSEIFVADRMRSLGRIRPQLPDAVSTKLVLLPMGSAKAFAAPWNEGHIIVITLGLFELLRSHAVNSMWSETLLKVERRAQTRLTTARSTLDLLNLRSLLFLLGAMPLSSIDEDIPREMLDGGWRVAELTTLFVMLHEVGHIHYKQLSQAEKLAWAHRHDERTLAEKEALTAGKLEELYADEFVLSCLPPELATSAVHASLVFFTLLGFLEASGFLEAREHPLAINRVATLAAHSGPSDFRALELQLQSMEQTRAKLAGLKTHGSEKRLHQLVRLAEVWEEAVDWRGAVRAVCTLAIALPV